MRLGILPTVPRFIQTARQSPQLAANASALGAPISIEPPILPGNQGAGGTGQAGGNYFDWDRSGWLDNYLANQKNTTPPTNVSPPASISPPRQFTPPSPSTPWGRINYGGKNVPTFNGFPVLGGASISRQNFGNLSGGGQGYYNPPGGGSFGTGYGQGASFGSGGGAGTGIAGSGWAQSGDSHGGGGGGVFGAVAGGAAGEGVGSGTWLDVGNRFKRFGMVPNLRVGGAKPSTQHHFH